MRGVQWCRQWLRRMLKQDKNFDGLAQKFERKIYGGLKGNIRLSILWDDLQAVLPQFTKDYRQLNGNEPKILDAGGGSGQFSVKLAQLGYPLVVNDLSAEMLKMAEQRFNKAHVDHKHVVFIHAPVQQLDAYIDQAFDVILFHAVLEWLAEPRATLETLIDLLNPGGLLSLMFYNKHSIVYRNLLRGNFKKVNSNNFQGDKGSLTPLNPLLPEQVYQWLTAQSMTILSKSGIRVFSDNMDKRLLSERSDEDIMELEKRFCREEPYLSLGRYIHVMCKKQKN